MALRPVICGLHLSDAVIVSELLPAQRGALLVYWLTRGERLTSDEISLLLGISLRNATQLAQGLGEIIPIEQHNGRWLMPDAPKDRNQ